VSVQKILASVDMKSSSPGVTSKRRSHVNLGMNTCYRAEGEDHNRTAAYTETDVKKRHGKWEMDL
jgi:hypothetical protein